MKAAHTKLWQTSDAILILFVPLTLLAEWLMPLPVEEFLDVSWLRIGGTILTLIGLGFIVVTRRQLHKSSQPAAPGKPTTQLLTSGIFHLSRNPIYLGIVLIYGGSGLVFSAPWGLIFAALLVVVFNIVLIHPEEKYLAAEFGDDYQMWQSRVRRWI